MAFAAPRSAALLFRHRVGGERRILFLNPTRVAVPPRRRARVVCCVPAPAAAAPVSANAKTEMGADPQSSDAALTAFKSLESPPAELRGKGSDMTTRYDPSAIEGLIYSWWESGGYFAPNSGVRAANDDLPPFVVCMPPPNVTGDLHMGHAMFVAVEDILARHARMLGRPTLYLPGKDHAGIATQLVVAKRLAAEGVDYRELPRDEFVDRVWQWKQQKGDYISKQLRKLGASCDWTRERFTLDPNMCQAVNEAFLTLHRRGLIYRGDYMVNWSPGLRTAVSDIEVDFSEEQGKLYYFRYPVEGGGDIPIATTRPETILGDTAVCVHPEDERYRHFIGKNAIVPIVGRKIRIIADEYVDREFGTGALKITPGHDTNDYELGKKHSLEIINIMNRDATLNENAGDFNGIDRFEARKKIWMQLEADGLVIKVEDHVSRVPRSQRGGEIIEPLVSTQWFVKMEGLARPALDAVRDKRIKIVPERFEKVYFNWLENIRDWCVSRQLVWGHQIPVWNVVEHPGDYIVATDAAHADQQASEKYGVGEYTLVQETDVLDTWFSSGLWPFATMGWPDKNAEDLKTFFPGSVLETGYDILFFWVARMIMLSLELTGDIPFHTVYLHGLVNDAKGRKMSKSIGNVMDPLDTIAQYGSDALRYSLVTGSTPGQDIPLSVEKIESNRNFANKLWNACRFILTNLDDISESERTRLSTVATSDFGSSSLKTLPLPERFIVSRLNALIDSVSSSLDSLSFGDAGRQIYEFLWDEFAAWYVEISKARLYNSSNKSTEEMAATARTTLVYVMDMSIRLLHPLMPFLTEALWQRLPRSAEGEQALITAKWPSRAPCDPEAEARFGRLQALVRAVRNVRAEYDVAPSKRVPVEVYTDSQTAQDIREELQALSLLARIEPSQFIVHDESGVSSREEVSDEYSSTIVEQGLRVVLPLRELIDHEKEMARVNKQISKVQKDLDGLTRRLSSPGFTEKAPEAVVKSARENAAKLEEQLQGLNERLVVVSRMAS